jgi:hypothetical protein
VTLDPEGYPVIPGRYGQIEWFSRSELAVYSVHPRISKRLWATPGVRRHQTGDLEMRALFPVEGLGEVVAVIRAKPWGGPRAGAARESGRGPGQTGTSAA